MPATGDHAARRSCVLCQSLETMLLAERAHRDAGKPPTLPASDSSKTISVELSDDSGVSERVGPPPPTVRSRCGEPNPSSSAHHQAIAAL